MDSNTERKLSLQYLFHLKTLEYAKKHINIEIKKQKNEINQLYEKRDRLAIPQRIDQPNEVMPSPWYSWRWAGQWLIFLAISFIFMAFLIARHLYPANTGGHILLNVILVFFRVISVLAILIALYKAWDSYTLNKSARNRYLNSINHYNSACQAESVRLSNETLFKEQLEEEIRKAWEELKENQALLENTKKARSLLYSANYIPYQFRNLEAVSFFYSQIRSSPLKLDDLIRYDMKRVTSGFNTIPDFIKTQDEIFSYLTLNKMDFWNSCKMLSEEVDNYMADKQDNTLEQNMQTLIDTIQKEGIGIKYNFNGPVGSVADQINAPVTIPMSDFSPSVENEVELVFERACHDLAEKIRQSNRENAELILAELEDVKLQMKREQTESKADWWARVEQALQNVANLAGIAGFGLATYFQFVK